MKRLMAVVLAMVMLAGCSGGGSEDTAAKDGKEARIGADVNLEELDDVIEITEKLFISQTNDIWLNTDDYLGKTIKYEGMFWSEYWDQTGNNYYYVYRYGPGCCGYDSNAGFEVMWDDSVEPYDDDTWVEVVGVLDTYEELGSTYLYLDIVSIREMNERGEEIVAN